METRDLIDGFVLAYYSANIVKFCKDSDFECDSNCHPDYGDDCPAVEACRYLSNLNDSSYKGFVYNYKELVLPTLLEDFPELFEDDSLAEEAEDEC